MTEPADIRVIGFDLGHGETALASVQADRTTQPELLDLPGSRGRRHISAVLDHPSEGVLIGESAITARQGSPYLGFKSPELELPEVGTPLRLFVSRIVADVLETSPPRPGQELRWVFGTPSGWPRETRERYAEILGELCPGQVEIVSESRAALLYARDSGEVAGSAHRVTGSVLIVDNGASTQDYTYVSEHSGRPLDHGNIRLGAALIDKEICRRLVLRSPQRKLLEKIIAVSPAEARYLEYLCRRAKEEFFRTDQQQLAVNPKSRIGVMDSVEADDGEEVLVDIRLSYADMQEVLDAPRTELGGLSWREAFRQDLAAALGNLSAPPIWCCSPVVLPAWTSSARSPGNSSTTRTGWPSAGSRSSPSPAVWRSRAARPCAPRVSARRSRTCCAAGRSRRSRGSTCPSSHGPSAPPWRAG
ncbi:hypothetical protein [Streptomyces sp. PA5.6]|uniref:hypothetical protein n=1 Tax=Streptomyces sp. PA5.6 TaxID=3035651 RepID=UPI00390466E6